MGFFDALLGNTAAQASRQAAAVQAIGYKKAQKTVQQGVDTSVGYLQPYAAQGGAANTVFGNAIGANGLPAQQDYYNNFQNDPGYLATRAAGIGAAQQGGAGTGAFNSGGTLKALEDFGQRQMQGQFLNRLNYLQGAGQQGYGAATGQGNYTMTGAGQIAGLQGQQGTAQASGIVGAANAQTAGVQNLFNAGVGLLGAGFRTPGVQNAIFGAGTTSPQSYLPQYGGGWGTSITPSQPSMPSPYMGMPSPYGNLGMGYY